MSEKKAPHPNGPIIIPKGNGLGWTLNFERKESAWILGAFIGMVTVYIIIQTGLLNKL